MSIFDRLFLLLFLSLSLKELAIYMYLYTQYLFWLNKFQNNVLYTFFITINV